MFIATVFILGANVNQLQETVTKSLSGRAEKGNKSSSQTV